MNSCRFWLAILFIVMAGVAPGCSKDRREEGYQQQKRIITKSEELDHCYLQGDVVQVRACLVNNAKLLEEATILEPIGRAQRLALVYFRLVVLETRCSNQVAAEANLLKARFWSLRKAELAGTDLDKAMLEIRQFTTERVIQYVDEIDRKLNAQKEAAYVPDHHTNQQDRR